MMAPKNIAKITKIIPLLAAQNDDHVRRRGTEGIFGDEKFVEANGSMGQVSDSSFATSESSVSDKLLQSPCGAGLGSRSLSWTVIFLLLVDIVSNALKLAEARSGLRSTFTLLRLLI